MKTTVINHGPVVICDLCNEDYTDRDDKGGFLFGSKAVCPGCGPKFEKEVKKYQEEEYIRDRAKEGESFKEFVYRLRGGKDAITTITSF